MLNKEKKEARLKALREALTLMLFNEGHDMTEERARTLLDVAIGWYSMGYDDGASEA